MIFRHLLFLLLLLPTLAHAGVEQLSEAEFRALATELASKVNLFSEAWGKDPEAEFYGGTTRDYLYWIKGQFREAKTAEEARAVAEKLRAMPVIDVRSFIIGDSDVDVFSQVPFVLKAEDFGVRKIDVQKPDVLDPATELGRDELRQGFVPAEKIRLGRDGFHQNPALGEGVKEIYSGRLTVHFADPAEFAKTKYAQEKLNHPILLALRYLRLQAIDYFREKGAGLPNRDALLSRMDATSAATVKKVIEEASDGKVLLPYLEQNKFISWLNGGIQKAFRSYTNPDAAKILMEAFGVTHLPDVYPGKIEPVNQYVFQQFRDEAAIEKALAEYGVDRAVFYRPRAEEMPDGFLYHGTKDEKAFRAILFQGVIGSSSGVGGPGLYGVEIKDRKFAEEWGKDPARLIRFPVRDQARIVDIDSPGEGKRIWEKYAAVTGRSNDFDGFARTFGVDVLRYPYGEQKAFVVKNSGALGHAEGVYRKLLPLPELLELAGKIHDARELLGLISVNSLSRREASQVLARAPIEDAAVKKLFDGSFRALILTHFFPRPEWRTEEPLLRKMLAQTPRFDDSAPFLALLFDVMGSEPWRGNRSLRKEILAKARPAESDQLLDRAPWRGDREFLEDILAVDRRGSQSSKVYLYKGLADEAWVPHADLILPQLEKEDPEQIGYQFFLSKPWQEAHPRELRELAHKYARRNRGGVDLLGDPWYQQDAELFEILASRRDLQQNLAHVAKTPDFPIELRNKIFRAVVHGPAPDLGALGNLQAIVKPTEQVDFRLAVDRAVRSGAYDNLASSYSRVRLKQALEYGADPWLVDRIAMRYLEKARDNPFFLLPSRNWNETFLPLTLNRWTRDGGHDPAIRQALQKVLSAVDLTEAELPFVKGLLESPFTHPEVRKSAESVAGSFLGREDLSRENYRALQAAVAKSAEHKANPSCEELFRLE